jgi:quercetin dioxygenase-like cupin family protein
MPEEMNGAFLDGLDGDVADWMEVASWLALAAPPATPRPELRARLLSAAGKRRGGMEQVAPGIRVLRAGEGAWKPTSFPGVTYMRLFVDRESGMATSYLRMDPGSSYPRHHHAGEEQSFVIQGSCHIGEIYLRQGDYARAAPGTIHDPILTDEACLLLIVSSVRDEILSS